MVNNMRSQTPDSRKDQIKRAALKVFAQHGLKGTKMSMIAAEAKISDGLSYRYFKSKDEILAELVRDANEGARQAFILIETMPGTPLEKVRTITHEIVSEDNHHFMLMQQVQSAADLPTEVAELLDFNESMRMVNVLANILLAGQREGVFIEEDPRKQAMWYLTTIVGLMNTDASPIEGYTLPTVDFFMRLIVKSSSN